MEDLPELRNLVLVDNEETAHNDLAQLRIRSMIDWRELLMWQEGHSAAQARRDIRLEKDDVINLQFTRYIPDNSWRSYHLYSNSGTTGFPKAVSVRPGQRQTDIELTCLVQLTHSNLLNNALSIARCMNFTEKDILCASSISSFVSPSSKLPKAMYPRYFTVLISSLLHREIWT